MMNLKQTVSLAILAAMLATGLASCANKKNNDVPGSGDTEAPFTYNPNNPSGPNGGTVTAEKPAELSYTSVTDTVYLIKNDPLKDANGQTVSPKVLEEALNRTGTSGTWSRINYNGVDYFVKTASLTNADIGEKDFTPCTKTMFVVAENSANVRKYPSSEDAFSTKIHSFKNNQSVTVIAQGTGWYKIQWSENGTTKTGYMHVSCLSDSKEDDWIKAFTEITPTKMYTTGEAFIRLKPFVGDKGTLAEPKGLPKGTEVTVIAKGTVEGRAWCMVRYLYNSKPTSCYISADMLSLTPDGSVATLDDIIKGYPTLQKLETPASRYVVDDKNHSQARVYSRPSRATETKNGVSEYIYNTDFLDPKTPVTVYAQGKIEGDAPSNGGRETLAWAVIKYEGQKQEGYSFISYSVLTTDPNGQLIQTVETLDELCNAHGFVKIATPKSIKVTKAGGIACWISPTSQTPGNIPVDAVLKIHAEGETKDDFVPLKWYIVEYNSSLWFILVDSDNYVNV